MIFYSPGDTIEYWAADVDPERFIPGPTTATAIVVSCEPDTTSREGETIQRLTLDNGDVLRSDYTTANDGEW